MNLQISPYYLPPFWTPPPPPPPLKTPGYATGCYNVNILANFKLKAHSRRYNNFLQKKTTPAAAYIVSLSYKLTASQKV